ncbi:hypothetical protein [Streptomyces qinglanensis]|uniref:hypothetical protein n=1 Tax=Streptomyces qinglanensis TaxID=943816 RepID=UPI003D746872
MDRPLVVADKAAALVNDNAAARALVKELLLAGRKNILPEPPPKPDKLRLPLVQYPTLTELAKAAAARRP